MTPALFETFKELNTGGKEHAKVPMSRMDGINITFH